MAELTFLNVVYLLVYIGCGSSNSLLLKSSVDPETKEYPYEPAAVTFTVELFKFIGAGVIIFFIQNADATPYQRFQHIRARLYVARLLIVPAALYFVFNVLAFYSLAQVQPATYRLLINIKVLFSGLLLQMIIGTRLTSRQWLGLFVLVTACIVEQSDQIMSATFTFASVALIIVQALCSSLAGVYFQYLLQVPEHAELGLWEKNFFLYFWSICFNLIYLFLFRYDTFITPMDALGTFDAAVVPIILTSAIGGFSTSLILRDMSVIAKEYANFAEMCVVVIGGFIVLHTPLRLTLLFAVLLVTASLYLYNVPPTPTGQIPVSTVENSPNDVEMAAVDKNVVDEDEQALLEQEIASESISVDEHRD